MAQLQTPVLPIPQAVAEANKLLAGLQPIAIIYTDYRDGRMRIGFKTAAGTGVFVWSSDYSSFKYKNGKEKFSTVAPDGTEYYVGVK